jgi:dynein light chain LC8-type
MADAEGEAATGPKTITRKVNMKLVEIPESMKNKCVTAIDAALDKHTIEKDVATAVKKKFDDEHGGTWHCVVGRNFGCSVTHQTKFLLFFEIDEMSVLLFCSDEPSVHPGQEQVAA